MREEDNYTVEEEIRAFCPFLGFADDPSTHTAFPSYQNVCHKARPLESPNLRYQSNTCLSEDHVHCEVLWQTRKNPLPKNIRAPRGQFSRKKTLGWKAILIFILLGGLGFAGFTILTGGLTDSASSQAATETHVNELMASAEAARWTETPAPTLFLTATPNSLEQTMTAFVVLQLSATPTPTSTNTPQPVATIAPPSNSNKPKPTKGPHSHSILE